MGILDAQFLVYTVIALIPNLLLMLWVMARLSHEVRLLKQKNAMVETDINLLDSSINSLTAELRQLRLSESGQVQTTIPSAPTTTVVKR